MRNKLLHLLSAWKQKAREYTNYCLSERFPRHERARYEGIATGSRWCIEDVTNMLEELDRAKRNKKRHRKDV